MPATDWCNRNTFPKSVIGICDELVGEIVVARDDSGGTLDGAVSRLGTPWLTVGDR